MNIPAVALECLLPGKKRFAICFEQVGSRWIEKWVLDERPVQKLVLESVNTLETDWPKNPPWQEVIKEVHDGLPVIMAIGRAGRSHWSAAWKVLATGIINVEYACRVHSAPEFMGTTFQLMRGVSCSQHADDSLALEIEGRSLRIRSGIGTSIDFSTEGRISIRPNDDGNESLPRTLQWQYRIE